MKPHRLKTSICAAMLLRLATFNLQPATAATVVGNLKDISQQSIDTRISFAPTNQVLVTSGGLSVGPPRIIDSTNGAFSIVLDAGDYTVSLPLLGWRKPFIISVSSTNTTVNITNLPITYPFPDHHPLHVNAAVLTVWSTNGPISLLDETMTIPAGTLRQRNFINVEAYGTFDDPSANLPSVVFMLRLGGNTIVSQTKSVQSSGWHLSALLTVRSAGAVGVIAGAMAIEQDDGTTDVFPFTTQTAVLDTRVAMNLDLIASIQNFTGVERLKCEQMVVRSP
jgi:hypothetical protein